jgi:hypothetical protein
MTDPSKNEWKAERATFHELQDSLNKYAREGWDLVYMFSPLTKDQGFTLVFRRSAQNSPVVSKTMGFTG